MFESKTKDEKKIQKYKEEYKKKGALDVVLDASLAHLLSTHGIFGPDPTSTALGLSLLSQLRLRHPVIPRLGFSACAVSRRANLSLPVWLAGRGVVTGKLA